MTLQLLLSSFLYITFLPAFLAGILYSIFLYKKSKAFEKLSILLVHLTTTMLTISQIALAIIMIRIDDQFLIVINSGATWMNTWELIAASWTNRWGSYHLWTWFTWLFVSFLFIKYYPNKGSSPDVGKFFQLLLWGSIIILFLLMGQRPFRAVDKVTTPIGLNPSLLSIWNILHPPIAFASYTGFFISWVISIYFWNYKMDTTLEFTQHLIKLDRIVTRLTWVLTSLVLTLGMVWSHEATWGGYWSWDAVQVIAVILWLVCGYRLHLHEVGANQGLYLLLGIIGFPLVFFAAWIITSNILGGLHSYASSPVAPLFLGLTIITLLPLIPGWVKNKWEPLSPVRVSGDVARPTGFNLGVLAFNFLIIGNVALILLQIINGLVDLNRDFEAVYPVINGFGFFAVTLGLLIDILQHKRISIYQITVIIIISSILISVAFVFNYPIKSQFPGIIQLFFIGILFVTIFSLLTETINKIRQKQKINASRLLSHMAMMFVIITIVANGSGASVNTRELHIMDIGEKIETDIAGTTVKLISVEIKTTDRGEIANVLLEVSVKSKNYIKTIKVIDQTGYGSYIEATWIVFPSGIELFMTLVRGDPLRYNLYSISGINLILEQYYYTRPLLISIILFTLIPIVNMKISKLNYYI